MSSVLLGRMLLVPGVAQVWYPKLSTGILALRNANDLEACMDI